MSDQRKAHFESVVQASPKLAGDEATALGIWELPDNIIDTISGGYDFHQNAGGGGINFAQNFSCFAQNIGTFSLYCT